MTDERYGFDGDKAFKHILKLAAYPRLAGTPGEQQAQAYLRGAYGNLGISFKEEKFAYSDLPLKLYLLLACFLVGVLSLLTSLAYLWGTRLIMLPALAMLVTLYAGFRWSGIHIWFASRGGARESQNFIGIIESVSGNKREEGTVMLSAHYDSKSQVYPVMVRAVLFILGFGNALMWGLVAFILAILAFAGKDLLGNRVGFYLTLLPAVFSLALVFNFTGNRSPGALDNASGEAVILELASALKRDPLEKFDVLVASFGCEEVGLCGSINYLLTHEKELREKRSPFFMMNFDIPITPSGKVHLNTGCEVPKRSTSPYLNHLAWEVAEEMGLNLHSLYLPTGAAVDHAPWVSRGFQATGFVSMAAQVHSKRDSVDTVNREALSSVGELALGVLRRLDREASAAAS